ncbi:MAG: sigma-54 dependent transcriptional regulator, partial [Sediminibacterium sp.]|nr:sigma-54 dependent transcriptional regulator [Sediminibacterium sp.]
MIVIKQPYLPQLFNMDLQAIKNRFNIVGNSPNLIYALQTAISVAPTDLSVLITGESGVGKENFSKIIHALSNRKHNEFIAINCGAIPEGTIDSELFGHEKGSFTGAIDARKGYFETVNGGTIFLDEIGEMPLQTQSRLLRVLENGEFIKVGSSKVQKTNVRIVAATNKNLLDLARDKKFREDLYYRLNTIPIFVPPLRERKDDIVLLFRKFAADFATKYKRTAIQLNDEAKSFIANYNWKGNIRELKNFTEQISILCKETIVQLEDLQHFLPDHNLTHNNLPILAKQVNQTFEFQNEREILYKYFFDLKKDIIELKKMFLEILQNPNGLNIENLQKIYHQHEDFLSLVPTTSLNINTSNSGLNNSFKQPIVLNPKTNNLASQDEPLNILHKEKELICKALDKHKGHRIQA